MSSKLSLTCMVYTLQQKIKKKDCTSYVLERETFETPHLEAKAQLLASVGQRWSCVVHVVESC